MEAHCFSVYLFNLFVCFVVQTNWKWLFMLLWLICMEFPSVCDSGSSWSKTTESSRPCLRWRGAPILPWLLNMWEPWGWILRVIEVFSSTCWKSTASTSCWLSTTPAARKTLSGAHFRLGLQHTAYWLPAFFSLFLWLGYLRSHSWPLWTSLILPTPKGAIRLQAFCALCSQWRLSACLSIYVLSILPAFLDFYTTCFQNTMISVPLSTAFYCVVYSCDFVFLASAAWGNWCENKSASLGNQRIGKTVHQRGNSHFPDPHIFAGYNGLVKSALNVISVFLKLLWMLHITQYCDGEDLNNLCHIFFFT